MHEYSIVQSLVDAVEKACPDRQDCLSSTVHRIHVRIGELSGVDADQLATA